METDLLISPSVLTRLKQAHVGLERSLSKNDRVAILILICIEEGITAGNLICLALTLCGYNRRHVDMTLAKGAAGIPLENRCYKDPSGHYVLPK